MSSKPILKIDSLSKTFRSDWAFKPIEAVKSVSLEVMSGEIFGFLGHNGAGKTTTIKCVLGLVQPTSGSIELLGKPLTSASQRKEIGFLPEQPYFYEHLNVKELLFLFASLYGLKGASKSKAVEEAVERLRLEKHYKSKLASLSKGWQQRVGMAQAILSNPKLVLLDEPFSGLDPAGRKEFREIILNLKKQGSTILFSTHILSDIEELCDRVSIMSKGKLWKVVNLKEPQQKSYALTFNREGCSEAALAFLEKNNAAEANHSASDFVTLKCTESEMLEALVKEGFDLGLKLERLERKSKSLEEMFMESLNA